MSTQRELVQAMIRRRVSKAKKIKEDSRIVADPRDVVIQFLGEFDEALKACNSIVEKYWLIEGDSQKLLSKLQRIDPEAQIELVWYGEDVDNLRLEGVRIIWGEFYRESNGLEAESLIDLASILFY